VTHAGRECPWRRSEAKDEEETRGERHLKDGEDVQMALGKLIDVAGCLEEVRRLLRHEGS